MNNTEDIFTESCFMSNIFDDIRDEIRDKIVMISVIDKQWKADNPEYIFDIMVDISTDNQLNIDNIKFENRNTNSGTPLEA